MKQVEDKHSGLAASRELHAPLSVSPAGQSEGRVGSRAQADCSTTVLTIKRLGAEMLLDVFKLYMF